MVNVFFTADTHLGHENIIKYCNRPFKSLEQMDKVLIHNWNQRVKAEDVVYFLGDFCFKNTEGGKPGEGVAKNALFWLSRLRGNVVFLKGNHDKRNSMNTKLKSCIIEIGGEEIYLCHNPEDFNKNYRINLVGHVHEKWKIKNEGNVVLVNVGVDQWNFRPVTWEEIMKEVGRFLKS
jgi:calcineurin-like phosphoesterase family protein